MATYALNMDGDGHVLSATYDQYGSPDQPRTDSLPDGDITHYDYRNGVLVLNEERANEAAVNNTDGPTREEKLEAEIDYIAMMTGVEL